MLFHYKAVCVSHLPVLYICLQVSLVSILVFPIYKPGLLISESVLFASERVLLTSEPVLPISERVFFIYKPVLVASERVLPFYEHVLSAHKRL